MLPPALVLILRRPPRLEGVVNPHQAALPQSREMQEQQAFQREAINTFETSLRVVALAVFLREERVGLQPPARRLQKDRKARGVEPAQRPVFRVAEHADSEVESFDTLLPLAVAGDQPAKRLAAAGQ